MKKAGRHLRTPPANGQIRNDPLGKKSPPFDASTWNRPEPVCWGGFSKVNPRAQAVKRHGRPQYAGEAGASKVSEPNALQDPCGKVKAGLLQVQS